VPARRSAFDEGGAPPRRSSKFTGAFGVDIRQRTASRMGVALVLGFRRTL
jgi:hypothetical protein